MKDIIDLAGYPTTVGSKLIASTAEPAAADAACLAGARAADARIVGKTNLVELAFGADGVNPWFGTPVNPIDAMRVPGGSSSGSAVAVVTGEADVALGTDTGGSVRIPAACCGGTGLKTTNGRVSLAGVHPLSPTLDTVGPMAANVDGLVLGMQLLEPGFAVEAARPARVARVRIPAAEWIDDSVDTALAAAGFDVVDVDASGWLAAWRPAMTLLDFEAVTSLGELMDHLDEIDPVVADRLSRSKSTTIDQRDEAMIARSLWRDELTAMFSAFDLLALPTIAEAVPTLDNFRASHLTACTVQANFAGVPAVALPVGSDKPIPASLQLVGPWDSEARLLASAVVVEQAQTPHR